MAAGTSNDHAPTGLVSFLLRNPWETVQFTMRTVTMACSVGFFLIGLGISVVSAYRLYLNVMLTSFITFGIRFYLRMKEAQISVFSRNFLMFFPSEDSGHYLIYTLLFYNQPPTTIFVIPMFLYSVLFTVKFLQGLVQFLPSAAVQSYVNVLSRGVASKQADIHRFIAYCEVFIIIILVWKALSGGAFLLVPFLYYQFLKLRYMSRRNASVRTVFSELRVSADYAASHPRCPSVVSNIISKAVAFISRLDPAATPTTGNTTTAGSNGSTTGQ